MMRFVVFLCTVVCILLNTGACEQNYEGYQLLHVYCKHHTDREILSHIVTRYQLDVWRESKKPEVPWHVLASPTYRDQVILTLERVGLRWEVHIENIQRLVLAEQKKLEAKQKRLDYDYLGFNDYNTIQEELSLLYDDCPEGFSCELSSIGDTYEGNPLNVLHIQKADGGVRKAVWLEAMMHAREWLAGATHMNIVQRLIREYQTNNQSQFLLDSYDWFLLPVVNPDGYIYTWTDDRLWRKNRTPNEGSLCLGTDLNRNYGHKWGEVGSSDDPCSNTYSGSAPSSEPVTQALEAQMFSLNDTLAAWVSLHTYGRQWLTPWAYTVNSPEPGGGCAYPEDVDELLRVANAATSAAQGSSGDEWEPGTWCDILYESSGTTQDHAKAVAGIPYAYTPELRGDGFIVDEAEIPISFEEVWAALVALVSEIQV